MPRLTQIDAFLDAHHTAIEAAASALAAQGYDPGEYTAEVSTTARGLLEIYLRHDTHPAEWSGRGDPCGRCRVVEYNPKTGASRMVGIR